MKKLILTLAFVLLAGVASADDAHKWGILYPTSWTLPMNVKVSYWFTEAGTQVGATQDIAGPLVHGSNPIDFLVDTAQFVNTGRTICLNASALRQADNATAVATPNCQTFPFGQFDAPTITVAP